MHTGGSSSSSSTRYRSAWCVAVGGGAAGGAGAWRAPGAAVLPTCKAKLNNDREIVFIFISVSE